jgi:hemolysin III
MTVEAAAGSTPRLRGRIHQVAFFVSIPAGVALVALAGGARERLAAAIFSLSLSGVFAASAAYHVGTWGQTAHFRMRRLDHSMIFVLIAGSYTPFCLLVLNGAWSTAILSIAWGGAAFGVTVKVLGLDGRRWVSGVLYITLGWVMVVALPTLVREVSPVTTALIVGGGSLYTAGAIVLMRHRPDPVPGTYGYHEVWHTMGVAASACHYAAIALVVLAGR